MQIAASFCIGVALFLCASATAFQGRPTGDKPAGPPNRWNCTYTFDQKLLPKGVTLKQDPKHGIWWIANNSDVPLVINAVYSNGKLAGGAKLVSGQVYHYFPTGIPQEGKQHLKGWQMLAKEITNWMITDYPAASKAFDGQDGKLKRDTPIPPPEPFALKVEYHGKPYHLNGTITYSLNEAYDVHYNLVAPKK